MRESGLPDQLWADGEMTVRLQTIASGADRLVRVRRPYALIGRSSGADVRIDDPAVSGRHLYLHLDHRGVFVVDLLTRTGTRDHDGPISTTWLRVGTGLDLAGHRVELVETRLQGLSIDRGACVEDPLAEFTAQDAPQVTLEPRTLRESRWILNSELVFLGRSSGCGVRVEGGSAARIHGVIVRTVRGVYLVDLIGRLIWRNRRPIHGASVLHNGDILTVGSSEFTVLIESPRPSLSTLLVENEPEPIAPSKSLATIDHQSMLMPTNFQASPAATQEAFLGWLFGLFQAGQGELIRRHGEFQFAMSEAMQQMREENATMLQAHLEKIEHIQREILALRSEVERVDLKDAPKSLVETALPQLSPLKIPARPIAVDEGTAAAATTAWLLERIGSLEDESRSSWRDLFSRIGSSSRRDG